MEMNVKGGTVLVSVAGRGRRKKKKRKRAGVEIGQARPGFAFNRPDLYYNHLA